jgi:microcystin-dependent protein
MKKMKAIIITMMLLSVRIAFSQVGVNTNSPTKALDVNGEAKVRNLPLSTSDNNFKVSTDSEGNLYKIKIVQGTVGDVKSGMETADHDGWYLLNGRAVTTLSATAKANAAAIGLTATLPNIADRMIKTKATAQSVGTQGGANTITLTQSNIPIYSVTTTTSSAGAHNHTWQDEYMAYGSSGIEAANSDYNHNIPTTTRTTSTDGNHTHTAAASTGGSSQALSVLPQYVVVNMFIYLGK